MSGQFGKDVERSLACPFCGQIETRERFACLRCVNCGACGPEGADPRALWQVRKEDRGLILERRDTVKMLRNICESYGDNEWEDNLHLADVLEKHLWRWLEEGEEDEQQDEITQEVEEVEGAGGLQNRQRERDGGGGGANDISVRCSPN